MNLGQDCHLTTNGTLRPTNNIEYAVADDQKLKYKIDIADERLWSGNKSVSIGNKAFQILRLFVENPNRLLTKNDILDIRSMLEQRSTFVGDVDTFADVPGSGGEAVAQEQVLPLDQLERKMIVNALNRFAGNRRLASRALNISERTLYRKIKEFELD